MENLTQTITAEIKMAMVAKDSLRLNTLRMLKSAIGYAAIEASKDELSDPEIISVIQKEAKKRKDAHEQFLKGGRAEQAEQEAQELKILESFLPTPFTPEELEEVVRKAITEVGATSNKEMGQVIKTVQQSASGRADGKAISQMVGKLLS